MVTMGTYIGPYDNQRVEVGQDVIVNLGAGDRKGKYLGRTGASCDDTRVVHVKDEKSGKQMAVPFRHVRLA